MTRSVVTIREEAAVRDAARLLVERKISGLPVVDAQGRVIGLITEADLIVRQRERPTRESWWHRFFADPERLAESYRKAEGSTVGPSCAPIPGIRRLRPPGRERRRAP
ncbi:MAG: CBS domain-containing protein [Candidatus Rokubacteria bacterium]|nr:CBS domain-containing protein [Candidatus Rokubacteria bacterium]